MAMLIRPEMRIRSVLKIILECNDTNKEILETRGWLTTPSSLSPMLLSLPTSQRELTHLYCLYTLQQKAGPLVLHIQGAPFLLAPIQPRFITLPPSLIAPRAISLLPV